MSSPTHLTPRRGCRGNVPYNDWRHSVCSKLHWWQRHWEAEYDAGRTLTETGIRANSPAPSSDSSAGNGQAGHFRFRRRLLRVAVLLRELCLNEPSVSFRWPVQKLVRRAEGEVGSHKVQLKARLDLWCLHRSWRLLTFAWSIPLHHHVTGICIKAIETTCK